MSLESSHATLTTLVLWACLSFSLASERPLAESTTTVLLPMKYFKSRADTYQAISGISKESKDTKNQVVRATGNNRSPGSVAVNFHRLPPSPANLLKPDGFQFYTYNERGDMITRQMTMQEIQALIASGGPDHSNTEIQEPQKAEDILTGGKKVMDVVEKVQSVLKSAMDKPLSTLSGSHPMIPENVNVEWSNILPAILAGDKYGNKVEESHYVEKPTSKPSSSASYVIHKQNDSVSDSFKPDVSETVAQAKPDDTNKYTNERNEQTKKNGTLPTIATKPTTISYTEKLMIPVSVITTEQNVELMAHNRYTTQSSILHKVTGASPLSESTTTYGSNVRDEENLASTSAITKPTTIGVSVSSTIGESIKNGHDNIGLTTSETLETKYNTSHIDETVTDQTDSLVTQTKTKPTTDISSQEYDKVPLKTQTPSMMEANQVQDTKEPFSKLPSQSSLPFTKPPLQFSVSFTKLPPQSFVSSTSTPASTNKYRTTTLVPSTTIHDTVTKPSDRLSEPIEPQKSSPSMELSIPSENEGKRNDSSEITTYPSTTNDNRLENANNTSEERIQESSSEMTMKFDPDHEKISSITISAPIVSTSTTELDKTANVSDISTKSDSIHVSSVQTNATEPTTNINETPVTSSNFLQAIALIENMLHTASPATNRPVIETITLPTDLSENLLPNTVASSLIADSYLSNSKTNETQAVFKETTVSSAEKLNSTETVTSNSELSTSVNEDSTNDTTKKGSTNENEIYRTSTTKDDLFTDQQKIESSLLKNELSTASETTTASVASSILDATVKTTVADGMSTSFANNAFNEQTSTYETTISSNEASTSTNTGTIIANAENITEGASQNNDKTSTTYLEYTTETSSEQDKQTFTYQTVIDELSKNLSESSTVIANLSNAEEHPVESSTDKIVLQSPLKKTEEQTKNDTVHTIVNQQKINISENTTMNQHETDILNNATMNEHKINILNDTAANQHKINFLNNTAVNQHKMNILNNATANQHKTNILNNATASQHKTNILNNATASQHKTNILNNATASQHKTNILNNATASQHKTNILNNATASQHKTNILNNATASQHKTNILNNATASQHKTNILNNATASQHKTNILNNATASQHKTNILNNATASQHKTNILNNATASQHKTNILNNATASQHKTNILNNATASQHKTNILNNATANQHKTNILNNATVNQQEINIANNTIVSQHKMNILNNTDVNELNILNINKMNILTNTPENQHKINILNNTTTTPLSDTKSSIVSSTPGSITTALNSITEESNEIKGSTMNSVDWNRSENKTKIPIEIYSYKSNVSMNNSIGTQLLGAASKLHNNESHINQKMNDSPSSMLQSKTNNTSINQHTWQRISLHQVIPSSTEFITGSTTSTKHFEASTSTMSTMVDASSTKYPSNYQSTPVNKAESTVSLNASKSVGGLDTSTSNASADIVNFSRLCNELAIKFWVAANSGLSTGRSLVLSPFGMTSLLAMIFLGARGSTSDQMNEILGLDNVATFNPHLIFQNVTDTVSLARHQGIANAAFVRELFADKAKVRRLLPFYKEQAQQFYEGLVTEVNFATISDLVRRRTNLLIRKQTGGRIKDFVKSNTVPLRSPLATISANVFQTDCNTSSASTTGRDGELYFAVSAAHRLRKLIPVPATVWRSNVLAGYEPSLDATVSAIGSVDKLVSTIFLVPGQQGHAAPGDTLDRLEQRFIKEAFQDGAWDKLLKVLIPRPSLELQVPKFSHRSIVNATAALKRMGLDQLFSTNADFKGINGIGNRLFLSDVLQMNLFSTCGDENIANGRHHMEIYPASPTLRNSRHIDEQTFRRIRRTVNMEPANYRTVSFKERMRTVERSEEKPRLKLDQPFLYFVRHNPTGLILHIGRFNPRLI
ncbi:mucin-3A isoform X2 [Bombus impatiens]|uniref:Mucin-3A isoform X2 n=1 Tax=Bombus impatiens TaxID=132113 RepID=A0A6P8L9S1_BOMIM|nr:mucin-3A isoform X2 [Bombus impatiens]